VDVRMSDVDDSLSAMQAGASTQQELVASRDVTEKLTAAAAACLLSCSTAWIACCPRR
jgi:hypothetical protein